MAILSGAAWCVVDILSNHQYPLEVFRYANTVICFLAFAIIGLLVQRLRQSLHEQLRVRRELEKALEEMKRSTEERAGCKANCRWSVPGPNASISRAAGLRSTSSSPPAQHANHLRRSPEAMQEVLHTVEQAEASAAG